MTVAVTGCKQYAAHDDAKTGLLDRLALFTVRDAYNYYTLEFVTAEHVRSTYLSPTHTPSENTAVMQRHNYTTQSALNGEALQSGYPLQHYRRTGNDLTDPLERLTERLRAMNPEEFRYEVQRCQQQYNDPEYQWGMRQLKKLPSTQKAFGMPEQPDLTQLIANGSRAYALAAIEQYLQLYAAWRESSDPGGLKAEGALELMDRQLTEEKGKRGKKREKREKQSRCVVQ